MVKALNSAIAAVSQDTARIQRAYRQLCTDNLAWDKALADLTAMVKEYGSSPAATRPYGSPTAGQPPTPEVSEFGPETIPNARPASDHPNRPSVEVCQGYRPAKPIQRFNNKSLNWPAWFRHFRAVADVLGWSKEQRALQLVSYLDETAMNVAQELGDNDLYNYDVLVKLLGDWFDPASRVSASSSRFHARSRRQRMQTPSLMPSLSCAGSVIRKVRRNYDRN